MWGNPMREREILLFSFRKVHISNNYTISSQEKNTSQHLNCPKIYLDFRSQKIRTVVRICPFQHLKICANMLYGQQQIASFFTNRKYKQCLEIHGARLPRFACPPHCCMDCTNLYSMAPLTAEISALTKQKILLEICAQCLLGNVPSYLSQAYSKILSQSPLVVSCTLPNAFFYKI
jgi:hypothetical protein